MIPRFYLTAWTGLWLVLSPSAMIGAEQKAAPAKPAAKTPKVPDLPPSATGEDKKPADDNAVPEDLLQDEHLREEFGVNQFTAPSIKKIFADLSEIGQLPYEKLKRQIPQDAPKDRVKAALALGALIADGFLVVQSEKPDEFVDVGRAVLRYAAVLGAGERVKRHTKTILENSTSGDWGTLREELARTQADVEAELVLLRDVEIAHLVSLGGYLRALEIVSTAAEEPFSEERARKLARQDILEYFQSSLSDLPPKLRERDPLKGVLTGIANLQSIIDKPDGSALKVEDVTKLKNAASGLVSLISEGK